MRLLVLQVAFAPTAHALQVLRGDITYGEVLPHEDGKVMNHPNNILTNFQIFANRFFVQRYSLGFVVHRWGSGGQRSKETLLSILYSLKKTRSRC